jgi:amino acid adenylation domain-containing protein
MNDTPITQDQTSEHLGEHASAQLVRVQRLVLEACAEALGVRKVNLQDNLLELGIDSISAMQMVSRLNQELGVEVGIRELFEAGTIERLVETVGSQKHLANFVIGSVSRPPLLPLSHAQERVWFLARLGYSEHYHVLRTFEIAGEVDVSTLQNAIQHVVVRHETLRTTFRDLEGKPYQYVQAPPVVNLRLCDLSSHDPSLRQQEVETAIRELCQEPFDLSQSPLMRIALITVDEKHHVLGFCLHHIISDGWSMGLLAEELSATYTAYRQGKSPILKSLPVQYADYVLWQQNVMTERLEKELAYWRTKLAAYQELELPSDHTRPAQISGRGGHVRLRLEGESVRKLAQFCQKQRITLFTLFMSSVYLLLKRYSGQRDICLGVPVANRDPWQVRDLVGLFVNTVVVRISLSPVICDRLMKTVQTQILEAQDHQSVPFEKVVETIQPKRDLARNPIFQVLVNHANAGREEMELGDSRMKAVDFDQDTAKLDLSFTLIEDPDGSLSVTVEYSRDLYERETVECMGRHLLRALAGLIEEQEKGIDAIELMSIAEREQVLVGWNRTEFEYRRRCIHEWVEEQARQSSAKVAVRWRGGKLSYGELEEKSRRLGLYLQRNGIGPESLVGICMGRNGAMIVGMLGIMKAGGGYVPVDPAYPKDRVHYMIKQSGVRIVVTESGLRENVREMTTGMEGVQVIELDKDWEEIEKTEGRLERAVVTGNVAYVLYTSGSTGQPKGVVLEHGNAVAFLEWAVREFGAEQLSHVLATTSLSFDLSIFEIFGPLVSGGEVVVVQDALELGEGVLKAGWMEGHEVKLINTVPSAIAELIRMKALPEKVRWVNLAGEALGSKTAEQVYEYGVEKLRNLYGPTEATTYATWSTVGMEAEKAPNIGRPVGNTRIYIVDENMSAVPVGVAGEIYIGGASLARGYAGRADLTADRFVPDPFAKQEGERLYRTGDLGRYGRDGAIEYIGRADQQVKVRGFRIECGEIEALLLENTEVKAAAVIAKKINNSQQLVAYYVAAQVSTEPAEIRKALMVKLPEYMVPGVYVELGEMPLTPNGKVDRKWLSSREVEMKSKGREYVAPETEVEKELCGIWEEVLGVKRVGSEDDFFELGGHSLLATQIVSRVEKQMGVELPLRELFQFSRVKELAAAIAGRQPETGLAGISGIERPAELPLSYAQERLWFLAQLGYSEHYHVPQVMKVWGGLDVAALKHAVSHVVERHESLRTGFRNVQGRPRQVIEERVAVALEERDLRSLAAAEREVEVGAELEKLIGKPFDLEQAPLMRMVLLRLEDEEHMLGLCLHHIICDAWSLKVLLKEISRVYQVCSEGQDPELKRLKVQYADYAVWQRQTLREEKIEEELRYWQERLAGYEDLDLPTDYPRPRQMSGKGGRVRLQWAEEEIRKVRSVCRERQITLNTLLMASVYVVLSRYSRQEDICLGMPVANRRHWESEGLIGFFVNMVTVRVQGKSGRIKGRITGEELLREIQKEIVEAQDRQDVPFEKVVEAVQPKRDLTRNPIFQVLVNYVNTGGQHPLTLGPCRIEEIVLDHTRSKFELSFNFIEHEDRELRASISYSEDIYERRTLQKMAEHLHAAVRQLVSNPALYIEDIELMTEAERSRVLREWNHTACTFSTSRLVHQPFADQAQRAPWKVALVFQGQQLTYGELNERTTQLALYLQQQGVGPDTLVGICAERSLEMVIAILGILKAGGAYVPIDPEYPEARIRFMIEDSNVRLLLTQQALLSKLAGLGGGAERAMLALDREWPATPKNSRLSQNEKLDNLAYMIYTSGSTGNPKGAMNTHRGILNRLQWMQEAYQLTSEDRVLQKTPFSFDVSVWEFLWPLMQGATLVLAQPGGHKEPACLSRLIAEQGITTLHFVPSMLQVFLSEADLESCDSLQRVICSGEALSLELKERFFERLNCKLYNLYGPTEAAVDVTHWECHKDDKLRTVPIGHPIANTQMFVLDREMKPVPVGVPGELYIGGDGLARGYWERPALTAEKFLPNPFALTAGQRLYQTGDLARHRHDGSIEYLGRLDHQVKLRGFRIELGEIEAALLRQPIIQDAAVIARQQGAGEKLLVAYVAVNGSGSVDATELRNALSQELPDYMVPAAFVALPKLPLSPNGKVDRKALMQIEVQLESTQEYVAPSTELEKQLLLIWEEVLDLNSIGIHDNFFEIGGNSLLAVQISTRIQRRLTASVSVRQVFEFPTVSSLSRLVGRSEALEHGEL